MAKRKDDTSELLREVETDAAPAARTDGPVTKLKPPGGMGPGDRPLVLTDRAAGPRPPRSTDETLPRCPRCSHDELAVLCPIASKQEMIRYYRCPLCDYSAKIMVNQVARAMSRNYAVPDSVSPEPVDKPPASAVRRPEI